MRTRTENRYVAAEAWLKGQESPRSKGSVYSEGDTIYSYGKHFPMAVKEGANRVWVNPDTYSRTTSKHQSALRGTLAMNGYRESETEPNIWVR